jgi:hypothetical protein
MDEKGLNSLTNFTADGVGTGLPGVVSSSGGTAKSEPFGVVMYTTSFTVDLSSSGPNGTGGDAETRGSGNITLTTREGDSIFMEQTGSHGQTSTTQTRVDTAGYVITGGTGRFSNATGTGNAVTAYTSFPAIGPTILHIEGNIQYSH